MLSRRRTCCQSPVRRPPRLRWAGPRAWLGGGVPRVRRFVEKADQARAAALVAAGALWNSGLFAWTARRFRAETTAVATELAPHLDLLRSGEVEAVFARVTPVAVDVSHFERSSRVAVVPGACSWED